MHRLVMALATVGTSVVGGLAPAAICAAASDTATTLLPVNDSADQLETHTWVDCKGGGHCDFIAGVHLRTPEGVEGFPQKTWVRQSTEVRPTKLSTYLDVHTNGGEGIYGDRGGPGTKVFKEGGSAVIQSIYNDDGPPEKYQTTGTIESNDWATGQPVTDDKVIVCATVQVVYEGVNLRTPSTCAQTTFS
jgi:hypothetical protein